MMVSKKSWGLQGLTLERLASCECDDEEFEAQKAIQIGWLFILGERTIRYSSACCAISVRQFPYNGGCPKAGGWCTARTH